MAFGVYGLVAPARLARVLRLDDIVDLLLHSHEGFLALLVLAALALLLQQV